MRLNAVLLAFTILWAAPTMAQSASDLASSDTTPVHNVFAKRTITALAGWPLGALAGGFVGAGVPHGPCGCDDPGLKEALIGVAIGGAVGAAVGAAAPKLNSHCTFARRLGLGLVGSVLGTGVGLIPITEGAQAITVPVFSIVGAALAESPC